MLSKLTSQHLSKLLFGGAARRGIEMSDWATLQFPQSRHPPDWSSCWLCFWETFLRWRRLQIQSHITLTSRGSSDFFRLLERQTLVFYKESACWVSDSKGPFFTVLLGQHSKTTAKHCKMKNYMHLNFAPKHVWFHFTIWIVIVDKMLSHSSSEANTDTFSVII